MPYIVRLGPEYFPDATRNRPIRYGRIYIGLPDTDPTKPANQITVTAAQEDGSEVVMSQPILTSAGGVPIYNGSAVTLLVQYDSYSLTVLNYIGAQEYYIPRYYHFNIFFDSISDMRNYSETLAASADRPYYVRGHTDIGDGGEGMFEFFDGAAPATYVDNNGTIIVPTGGDGSSAWIRQCDDNLVNVKWFGAKGDGVTDDYTAIQGAIDAVGRGKVLFPVSESSYQIGTGLVISESYVELHGMNYNNVFIRTTGDINALTCSNYDGIKVKDIQFLNTAAAGTCRGINFTNVHNWSFDHVIVSAFHDGFFFYNCFIGLLTDCESKNNVDRGMRFEYQTNDINLYHCSIHDNGGDGLYIKGATGSGVSGRAFVVHGGDIEFNDDYQIRIRDTYDVSIQGVYFEHGSTSNVNYDINIDMDTYPNQQVNITNCSFTRADTGTGSGNIYADDVNVLNIKDNYMYVTGGSTSRNPIISIGTNAKIVNLDGNRPDAGGGAKYGIMCRDYGGKVVGRKGHNIVLNAGFSNVQSAIQLQDWVRSGGTCIQSTDIPIDTPYYAYSAAWTQSATSQTMVSTLVDCKPSSYYWASVWIKIASGAVVGVRIYDDGAYLLAEIHENDLSTGWNKYHIAFQTQPTSDKLQWYFYWKAADTKTVYIFEPVMTPGLCPIEFTPKEEVNLITKFQWDPGNLVDGAGETFSVTVTGAALGDFVQVSAPYDLQDMIATAYVQAADTVEVRLQNESGSAHDLGSDFWYVRVTKRDPL